MSEISTLKSRNIVVDSQRTSVRLEPAMWQALEEIARRETMTISQICSAIHHRRTESSLTAAIRVFIMAYFRDAATEIGHRRAGHGRMRSESAVLAPQLRANGSRRGRLPITPIHSQGKSARAY